MFCGYRHDDSFIINHTLILVFFSLIKEEKNRPKYQTLLQHSFIQLHEKLQPYVHPEVSAYIQNVLESMSNNGMY